MANKLNRKTAEKYNMPDGDKKPVEPPTTPPPDGE